MRLCNGLTVRGQLELDPGVYVIDGGDFTAGASAQIQGEGVTIILTGASSSTVATVNINGGASVQLRAPYSHSEPAFPAPEWYGMLMYQDPIADSSVITNSNWLAGDASTIYDGIVYMPSGKLNYVGTSGMASTCLKLVANTLNFAGEAEIGNACPSEITDIEWSTRYVMVVE
jgi:hypothetical protein